MEAELSALADAGATVLVGLMVTDFWKESKERFIRILTRGKADARILRLLEESRADLIAVRTKAEEPKTAAIRAYWRTRLHDVLQSYPAAREELRYLLNMPATGAANSVYNMNNGNVYYGSVVQSGQICGNINERPPKQLGNDDA